MGSINHMSAQHLLEVRDLKTWFPIRRGVLQRVTGHVKAVDGVNFYLNKGEGLQAFLFVGAQFLSGDVIWEAE